MISILEIEQMSRDAYERGKREAAAHALEIARVYASVHESVGDPGLNRAQLIADDIQAMFRDLKEKRDDEEAG